VFGSLSLILALGCYGPIAEVTVRAEQHRARQQREENQASEK
jgi:hypothetical protein